LFDGFFDLRWIRLAVVRAERHRVCESTLDTATPRILEVSDTQCGSTARVWTKNFIVVDPASVAATGGFKAVNAHVRHRRVPIQFLAVSAARLLYSGDRAS
jgi:hypothetical protein